MTKDENLKVAGAVVRAPIHQQPGQCPDHEGEQEEHRGMVEEPSRLCGRESGFPTPTSLDVGSHWPQLLRLTARLHPWHRGDPTNDPALRWCVLSPGAQQPRLSRPRLLPDPSLTRMVTTEVAQEPHSEGLQLSLDPAVAPPRVFLREPKDQVLDLGVDGPSTWRPVRLSTAASSTFWPSVVGANEAGSRVGRRTIAMRHGEGLGWRRRGMPGPRPDTRALH